ncbi:MAG: aminotransferase class V-fold PLP-dependent enzyme [Clostridia bacterium]
MDFNSVRSLAPMVDKVTYLETPARGLYVKPVAEYAHNAITGWENFDVDITNDKLRKDVNQKVAKLLKVDAKNVTCTNCTSHGLSIIANSFPWKENDNLIISESEHPNNFYPWAQLKNKGVNIKIAKSENGFIDINNIISLVDDNTKVIAVSLVSFYPGAYNDVKKLKELLKNKQVYIVLDVIQAFGFLPIYPEELGVDALATASYKGLMSPHGGGVMYVNDDLLHLLSPDEVTMLNVSDRGLFPVLDYSLISSADKLQPMPINISQLASMSAALDIILDLGIEEIGTHLNKLAKAMIIGLNKIGIETKLSADDPRLKHIVCFDKEDAKELEDFARENKLYLSARRTGIRMGFHIYNNMNDVERALDIIAKYYKKAR